MARCKRARTSFELGCETKKTMLLAGVNPWHHVISRTRLVCHSMIAVSDRGVQGSHLSCGIDSLLSSQNPQDIPSPFWIYQQGSAVLPEPVAMSMEVGHLAARLCTMKQERSIPFLREIPMQEEENRCWQQGG